MSSDQVKRIREFVCGRCADFSGARTTWKTAEELATEERKEAEAEERRRERKRKLVARRKLMVQGKKRKVEKRGVESEVLVAEAEDQGDGSRTATNAGL